MDVEQNQTMKGIRGELSSSQTAVLIEGDLTVEDQAIILTSGDQSIIVQYSQLVLLGIEKELTLLLHTESLSEEQEEDTVINELKERGVGSYVLRGNYVLRLDFSQFGGVVMREVHDLIQSKIGDEGDDEQSDENMITAEDLDQNQGKQQTIEE